MLFVNTNSIVSVNPKRISKFIFLSLFSYAVSFPFTIYALLRLHRNQTYSTNLIHIELIICTDQQPFLNQSQLTAIVYYYCYVELLF